MSQRDAKPSELCQSERCALILENYKTALCGTQDAHSSSQNVELLVIEIGVLK